METEKSLRTKSLIMEGGGQSISLGVSPKQYVKRISFSSTNPALIGALHFKAALNAVVYGPGSWSVDKPVEDTSTRREMYLSSFL